MVFVLGPGPVFCCFSSVEGRNAVLGELRVFVSAWFVLLLLSCEYSDNFILFDQMISNYSLTAWFSISSVVLTFSYCFLYDKDRAIRALRPHSEEKMADFNYLNDDLFLLADEILESLTPLAIPASLVWKKVVRFR